MVATTPAPSTPGTYSPSGYSPSGYFQSEYSRPDLSRSDYSRPDSATPSHHALPTVRRIGLGDLRWALREGWDDFREKRGDILMVGFLYPLVGLVTVAFALNGRLVPLAFPLVAGLSLMGPAVATGFYELARRREAGLESGWAHFLDPWRDRRAPHLAVVTLALAGLFLAWITVAWQLYQGSFGWSRNALSIGSFLDALFTTEAGWRVILLGNIVGLGFALVALAASLCSFAMIVDGRGSAGDALATSFRAAAHNPGATLAWGLIVAALLVIGCIPLFIGLAVVMPVLGYATWHLYTRLVEV